MSCGIRHPPFRETQQYVKTFWATTTGARSSQEIRQDRFAAETIDPDVALTFDKGKAESRRQKAE